MYMYWYTRIKCTHKLLFRFAVYCLLATSHKSNLPAGGYLQHHIVHCFAHATAGAGWCAKNLTWMLDLAAMGKVGSEQNPTYFEGPVINLPEP